MNGQEMYNEVVKLATVKPTPQMAKLLPMAFENALAKVGNDEVRTYFWGDIKRSSTKLSGIFTFVLTSQKLIMSQKNLMSSTVDSVFLNNITNISKSKSIGFSKLDLETINHSYSIASNEKLIDRVIDLVNEIKSAPVKSSVDSFEQIKKLKELLDMGAITQVEFDAKKKELL